MVADVFSTVYWSVAGAVAFIFIYLVAERFMD